MCFNPYTHEIIGFKEGACNTDVIKAEINGIMKYNSDNDTSENISRAKLVLLNISYYLCLFDGTRKEAP